MALPPLELFSLKKRPPCCRAAFSRSDTVFWLYDVGWRPQVRHKIWSMGVIDKEGLADSRDIAFFASLDGVCRIRGEGFDE
jgi:hypothetical protein